MKTPVEMQLKIVDKMRENVESRVDIFMGIEWLDDGEWIENTNISFDCFRRYKFRVKPETIMFNDVEIPKPLTKDEIFSMNEDHHIWLSIAFGTGSFLVAISNVKNQWQEDCIFYKDEGDAIEASKKLFNLGV